jgi:GNAT superfamily N-acetyltransferase
MTETAIRIEEATAADAATVVALVGRLLAELGGFQAFEPAEATALCARLLATEGYTALLARDEHREPLGVLTLQECPTLYVAGTVGWIQEVYVAPTARSRGVGHVLVDRAVRYGQQHGWRRLEVNTPEAAAWPRTVSFYEREGFAGGSMHLRKPLM